MTPIAAAVQSDPALRTGGGRRCAGACAQPSTAARSSGRPGPRHRAVTLYVVDASVAVKWLAVIGSSGTTSGQRTASHRAGASFAEASNALWAMCRRADITKADFAEAIGVLKAAPVAVPVPMRQLAAAAARLAVDLDHPTFDCFYLALAMHEQRPVVTADRRFRDIVRKHPYLSDRIVHLEELPTS